MLTAVVSPPQSAPVVGLLSAGYLPLLLPLLLVRLGLLAAMRRGAGIGRDLAHRLAQWVGRQGPRQGAGRVVWLLGPRSMLPLEPSPLSAGTHERSSLWPAVGARRPWCDQRDRIDAPVPQRLAGPDAIPWGFEPERPWPGVTRLVGATLPRRFWQPQQVTHVTEVWTGSTWEVVSEEPTTTVTARVSIDAWGRAIVGVPGRPFGFPPVGPSPIWTPAGREGLDSAICARLAVRWGLLATCRTAAAQGDLIDRAVFTLTDPTATPWRGPGGHVVSPLALLMTEPAYAAWWTAWAASHGVAAWRPLLLSSDPATRLWAIRHLGHAASPSA